MIEEELIRLGRDASNELKLQDTEVSRIHAEVCKQDGRFLIVDLQSSNGTFVNGEPVQRHVLQSGDRVQVGRTVMLFTQSELKHRHDSGELVDIVDSLGVEGESRIVSTLGQEEGSRLFSQPQPNESPWLARARSNLQVMYRTSLAVSHTLDIDELLHRILELIFEWLEADRGCILLLDNASNQLTPKATRNRRESNESQQWRISRTILEYVLKQEEGVLTSDAQDDQRWNDAASVLSMGIHEAICVPMQGRYGIVGIIYIDTHIPQLSPVNRDSSETSHRTPQSRFSEEHLKLMVAIGHQAALAVEDTSYYSAMLHSERLAAVGQTVATLSHHIKNILQGIRGGSYLIEEGLKASDFEVVGQGWKIVERNQERISGMVMDMLSFSKERKPEIEMNSLGELLQDIQQLVSSRAADQEVEISFQIDPQLPPVGFDKEGLHRAVLNVVNNAIDACHGRPNGNVRVAARVDYARQVAAVQVDDNGLGIEPTETEAIFQAFQSSKGGRGTGLGLPVSRKILREHGGDIYVSSQLNVGSRFELVFPIRRPASETLSSDQLQTNYLDEN